MKQELFEFFKYTGEPIEDLFHYISTISIGIALISVFKMLWYLNEKGEENSRLYSFNPIIPIDYARITKREEGKTGIWLKVLIISIVFLVASELMLAII